MCSDVTNCSLWVMTLTSTTSRSRSRWSKLGKAAESAGGFMSNEISSWTTCYTRLSTREERCQVYFARRGVISHVIQWPRFGCSRNVYRISSLYDRIAVGRSVGRSVVIFIRPKDNNQQCPSMFKHRMLVVGCAFLCFYKNPLS